MLAIAGSLLVEISLPKLLFALTFSILFPALLLGLAPLVATAWLLKLSTTAVQMTEYGAAFVLMAIVVAGFAHRAAQFLVAQCTCDPARICILPRGAPLSDRVHAPHRCERQDARALGRDQLGGNRHPLCIVAVGIAVAVWPVSRWVGTAADLLDVRSLILPMLANAVVVVCTYLAAAALVWGFADAARNAPVPLTAPRRK